MSEILLKYWDSIIISISIIIIQLSFFVPSILKINRFKDLFSGYNFTNSDVASDKNDQEIKIIKPNDENSHSQLLKLIEQINDYLVKNKGVIDFAVLKNIIEREISSEEEASSSNVNLPLYLGLMGTFIGIVYGLFRIGFSGGVTDSNISSFIGGVIIAMIASFFGLLLTVINNFGVLQNAKLQVLYGKNNFLNFIQTELLPHLQSNLYQALNILKTNINIFNEKFEKNIDLFDTQFASNIKSLKESVDKMSSGMDNIVENTNTQSDFLKEFKKIKYQEIVNSNKELLEQIEKSSPLLKDFIKTQKTLNDTTRKSEGIVEKVNSLFNRITKFEESINNLGESINTNEFLGNDVLILIKKNLEYLNKQYELLKQHSMSSSDSIKDFFKNEYDEIQELSQNVRSEIQRALDFNIDHNPFRKLDLLDRIVEKLEDTSTIEIMNDLKNEIIVLKNNSNEIKTCEEEIGISIQKALDFNIDENPFKKLELLDKIVERLNETSTIDIMHELKKEIIALKENSERIKTLEEILGHLRKVENNNIDKESLKEILKNISNGSDKSILEKLFGR